MNKNPEKTIGNYDDLRAFENRCSTEFPVLIDSIVKRLTDLKINTEHLVAVFDKGNNSEDNIASALSHMHIIASAKSEQSEALLYNKVTNHKKLRF